MSTSQVFTGARAVLMIKGQRVGLFSDVSWSIRQSKEPQFILGRFNPAEITQTSQDAVSMSMSGFRFLDADKGTESSPGKISKSGSPYNVAGATKLSGLLNEEDFVVQLVDRKSGNPIFTVQGCKVVSWSSGVAARGVSSIRIEMIGIHAEDETGDTGDSGAPNSSDGA